jgi:hypothetical protein
LSGGTLPEARAGCLKQTQEALLPNLRVSLSDERYLVADAHLHGHEMFLFSLIFAASAPVTGCFVLQDCSRNGNRMIVTGSAPCSVLPEAIATVGLMLLLCRIFSLTRDMRFKWLELSLYF